MRALGLLLLLIATTSCYENSRECSAFKTGTFKFEALVGTEIQTTLFVRKDTIEIDYYQGKADTASIRWINECEYVVKKLNPKNMAEQKAIHIKILSTEGGTYTFEYGEVGKTRKERGVAYKVPDTIPSL